jgi:exodeoxyribonuclease V alpha subunit
MHGGLKVYRGSPTAARSYVEADRSRADDYYLAEGTGVADRHVASEGHVLARGALDGDAYEAWVAGHDPDTGVAKGRLRTDAQGVRFVEVVVNGPKSWSLAAALHPDIAAAYDGAQDRAAAQVIGWLADHATTRIGPRGRQVQVPVQELEAVTVRHYTSRAGDPHRHLHLQVNARVFAQRRWRGLHTVGVRDSLDAINGIGHAAVLTDPQFRAALDAHGYTVDAESGEVVELAAFVGPFSARAAQITRNMDRYEAQWRITHPGTEPGPRLRRSWDARAWAQARPDKVIPTDGAELAQRWVEELHGLGYRDPQLRIPPLPSPTRELPSATPHPSSPPPSPPLGPRSWGEMPSRVGEMDREGAVKTVLTRLGGRRSAWNAADIRGEVEQWIARTGLVAEAGVRLELAEDLTARALAACVPLLARPDGSPQTIPEHIRALTSPDVLAVEDDLTTRLITRAESSGDRLEQPIAAPLPARNGRLATSSSGRGVQVEALDATQQAVAAALAGTRTLVVVEGAAGVGKTTTLTAARAALASRFHIAEVEYGA